MEAEEHVDTDTLAAFLHGALSGEFRRQVALHLATGCTRCTADLDWITRLESLARADRSVEPPPTVLARALRIMPVTPPVPATREPIWRRVRALPIFDSRGAMTLAGARGAGNETRQLLFAVEELRMEIALQVRRFDDRRSLDVYGQVFFLDQLASASALQVVVPDTSDPRETVTSALGEFHLEVPLETSMLELRVSESAVEVPVPQ